ncbi:hypothetical protein A2634_01900 [Candidatus Amesbacteria bacterium RIFCSPHIGHO2_01_FULL_48_32]|uniref:Uncharacterized protein n=1 Tax=Candidatus Amesbacteria bacterium RIFCSPLOWO2_01_FULL_48_25 TaxID=1797259 RepID=A0A1F4ZDH9_9BACT|nr:MAG: hypothetical protein A2634_01900 [Candidatus Amesbacteria bacterium RIFCSPHIGHO2_01_FULL_48_32]OGD04343.1 MAG: hypothetical protein A2989_04900 [Candidatus Amesbacteria bacterium RIFCSPLOWO2_01_FULL_48_25]HJZ06178.1 hypothetical protein [Patescibacteria group bacterium]
MGAKKTALKNGNGHSPPGEVEVASEGEVLAQPELGAIGKGKEISGVRWARKIAEAGVEMVGWSVYLYVRSAAKASEMMCKELVQGGILGPVAVGFGGKLMLEGMKYAGRLEELDPLQTLSLAYIPIGLWGIMAGVEPTVRGGTELLKWGATQWRGR